MESSSMEKSESDQSLSINNTGSSINIAHCFAETNITATVVNVIEERLIIITASSIQKPTYQIRWWGLPSKRTGLVNRATLNQTILAKLQASLPNLPAKQIVLCGIAGAGKTTLALEAVYKALEIYQNILWFKANDRHNLQNEFVKLAEALKLNFKNSPEAVIKVKEWIEKEANCLVILDGALNDKTIKDFLPQNTTCLITTHYTVWPNDSSVIEIPTFIHQEAVELVTNSLKLHPVLGKNNIHDLIKFCDNHPLGLAQSLAYIQSNLVPISRYLTLVEQQPEHILKGGIRKTLPLYYHGSPIFNLWDDLLSTLPKNSLALNLLNLLSCFTITKISKVFLKNVLNYIDAVPLNEAISLLSKYSLIKVELATDSLLLPSFLQTILWYKQSTKNKIALITMLADFCNEAMDKNNTENLLNYIKSFLIKASAWLNAISEDESKMKEETYLSIKEKIKLLETVVKNNNTQAHIPQETIVPSLTLANPVSTLSVSEKIEEVAESKEASSSNLSNLSPPRSITPPLSNNKYPASIMIENSTAQNIKAITVNNLNRITTHVTEEQLIQDKIKYIAHLWNVPSQNPHFTGRESILNNIKTRLAVSSTKNYAPIVITAFHGLGGVGKTEIVKEFIYRNQSNYNNIFWIPAENTDQIRLAFIQLAKQLAIVNANATSEEAISTLRQWFNNNSNNLLIFDNASKHAEIEKYLPHTGNAVLITSRENQWPELAINVTIFSEKEAYNYFIKIIGDHPYNTPTIIQQLAAELGYLPLALAQAAAYIRQNEIKVEEYLRLYRERKSYFLNNNTLPVGQDHEVVYITWEVTIQKIKAKYNSELARQLLMTCAYLFKEKIPEALLIKISQLAKYNPNAEIVEEALGTLHSYSMLNLDPQNRSISIHSLVQEVIIQKATQEERAARLEQLASIYLNNYTINFSNINFSLAMDINLYIFYHIKNIVRLAEENKSVTPTISQTLLLTTPETPINVLSLEDYSNLENEIRIAKKLPSYNDQIRFEAFARESMGICYLNINPLLALKDLQIAHDLRQILYNNNPFHIELLTSRYSLAVGKFVNQEIAEAESMLNILLNECKNAPYNDILYAGILSGCFYGLNYIYRCNRQTKKLTKLFKIIGPILPKLMKSVGNQFKIFEPHTILNNDSLSSQAKSILESISFFLRLFNSQHLLTTRISTLTKLEADNENSNFIVQDDDSNSDEEIDNTDYEILPQSLQGLFQEVSAMLHGMNQQLNSQPTQADESQETRQAKAMINNADQLISHAQSLLSGVFNDEDDENDLENNLKNLMNSTVNLFGIQSQASTNFQSFRGATAPNEEQKKVLANLLDTQTNLLNKITTNFNQGNYDDENESMKLIKKCEKISKHLIQYKQTILSTLDEIAMLEELINKNTKKSFSNAKSSMLPLLDPPLKQLIVIWGGTHITLEMLKSMRTTGASDYYSLVNAAKLWELSFAEIRKSFLSALHELIANFVEVSNDYIQASDKDEEASARMGLLFILVSYIDKLSAALEKIETGSRIINFILFNYPSIDDLNLFCQQESLDYKAKPNQLMPDEFVTNHFCVFLQQGQNTIKKIVNIYHHIDNPLISHMYSVWQTLFTQLTKFLDSFSEESEKISFVLLLLKLSKQIPVNSLSSFIESIPQIKSLFSCIEIGILSTKAIATLLIEKAYLDLANENLNIEQRQLLLLQTEQLEPLSSATQLIYEFHNTLEAIFYILTDFPQEKALKEFLVKSKINNVSYKKFLVKEKILFENFISFEPNEALEALTAYKQAKNMNDIQLVLSYLLLLLNNAPQDPTYYYMLAIYYSIFSNNIDQEEKEINKKIAETLFKISISMRPLIVSLGFYSNFLFRQQRYLESFHCTLLAEGYLENEINNIDSYFMLSKIEYPLFNDNIGQYLADKENAILYSDILIYYLNALNNFHLFNKISKNSLIKLAQQATQHGDFVSFYFLANCCQLLELSPQAKASEALALLAYTNLCYKNNQIDLGNLNFQKLHSIITTTPYLSTWAIHINSLENIQQCQDTIVPLFLVEYFSKDKLKIDIQTTSVYLDRLLLTTLEEFYGKSMQDDKAAQLEQSSQLDKILQDTLDEHSKRITEDEKLKNSANSLLTQGFFAHTPKSQNDLNEIKLQEIKKEYNLTDLSQRSLGKALRNAVNQNREEEVAFLIDHIDNINIQDTNPKSLKTALHYAVINQHISCCRLLLDKKARTDIKDANNLTSEEYAQKIGNINILKMMSRYAPS